MLSIQRLDSCWRQACSNHTGCHPTSLYCETNTFGNNAFLPIVCSTNGDAKPDPTFGIFLPALRNVSSSKSFFEKLFYCFWWGLQNLRFAHKKLASSFLFFNVHLFIGSSIAVLGQNMITSTNTLENLFAVFVSTSGLVLFALLIGNVQVQTVFFLSLMALSCHSCVAALSVS